MGLHEGAIKMLGVNEKYRGECSCGAAGLWDADRQKGEDFLFAHMQQVARARAHLQSRTPPLASQADYYRQQAEEPGVSDSDRDIWYQLADELDTRLGRKAPPYEDIPLFSDQPFRKE